MIWNFLNEAEPDGEGAVDTDFKSNGFTSRTYGQSIFAQAVIPYSIIKSKISSAFGMFKGITTNSYWSTNGKTLYFNMNGCREDDGIDFTNLKDRTGSNKILKSTNADGNLVFNIKSNVSTDVDTNLLSQYPNGFGIHPFVSEQGTSNVSKVITIENLKGITIPNKGFVMDWFSQLTIDAEQINNRYITLLSKTTNSTGLVTEKPAIFASINTNNNYGSQSAPSFIEIKVGNTLRGNLNIPNVVIIELN